MCATLSVAAWLRSVGHLLMRKGGERQGREGTGWKGTMGETESLCILGRCMPLLVGINFI